MKIEGSEDKILTIYRKKQFAKICKNLARYKSENNVGTLKLYTVERLSIDNKAAKSFNILPNNLSVLHNYFDVPNKIIFRSVSS